MGASDFETKDSGERAVFESGMQRDTEAGKPRFDLMLPLGVPYEEQMITRLAALFGRGSVKYDARNWEQADSQAELDRMKSSAFRHFMQWMAGETDEDHAAAVMFNLIAWESTAHKMRHGVVLVEIDPETGTASGEPSVPDDPRPDGSDCEEAASPACEREVPWLECPVLWSEGCKKSNHRGAPA